MYLYFDSQGNLREIINDEALRQGNSNINKLYIYWEGYSASVTNLYARYKLNDDSLYPSSSTYQTEYSIATGDDRYIPYDATRDLKYFQYGVAYDFCIMTIPDGVLEVSGSTLLSLWFVVNSSTITTMGKVAFEVEETTGNVAPEENISIAQWNELMKVYNVQKTLVVSNLTNISAPTNSLLFNLSDNKIYLWNGTTASEWDLKVDINNIVIDGNYYSFEYDNSDFYINTSSNGLHIYDNENSEDLFVVNSSSLTYKDYSLLTFVVSSVSSLDLPSNSLLFNTSDNKIYLWNGVTASEWTPDITIPIANLDFGNDDTYFEVDAGGQGELTLYTNDGGLTIYDNDNTQELLWVTNDNFQYKGSNIALEKTATTIKDGSTDVMSSTTDGTKSTLVTFNNSVAAGDKIKCYFSNGVTDTSSATFGYNNLVLEFELVSAGTETTNGCGYGKILSISSVDIEIFCRINSVTSTATAMLVQTIKSNEYSDAPAGARAMYLYKVERIR